MDVALRREKLILILSNKWDISVDFIVRELSKRGENFIRLNTEDLPYSDCTVSLPDFSFLLPDGKEVTELVGNLKSVLFRRPGRPFEEVESSNLPSEPTLRYSREQWHALIEGLLSINGVLWINNPRANDLMECKIVQLWKAVELGFSIPRTCITSSKEKVEKFIQSCGGCVVAKSLYSSLIEYTNKDFFVFTTIIKNLKDIPSPEIGIAPVIFQEYMDPKIDYRVTVIGEKAYAVRIESTKGESIPADWRTEKGELKFIPCELPNSIRKMCISFVSRCGLVFGAIDLVQVNDYFYFLEINPNGEWGWLQKGTRLPIAETITDCLVKGKL